MGFLFFVWGYVLNYSHGHYNVDYFWITSAVLVLSLWVRFQKPLAPGKLVSIALIYFCWLGMRRPLLLYASPDSYFFYGIRIAFALSLLHLVSKKFLLPLFICLVVTKALVISASPSPHIDTFTMVQEAVRNLWRGVNPYEVTYPDIYDGKFDYSTRYCYWPITIYVAAVFDFLFKDIRWGFWASDLLAMILLARHRSLLLLCLWEAFPVQYFVLEQSWNEPLLILFLTGTLVFEKSGVFFALFSGIKQYTVLFFPFFLRSVNRKFWAATAAIFLPWVLWNPKAFWFSSVESVLKNPLRYDSLSLSSYLWNEWGVSMPVWLRILLMLTSVPWIFFRHKNDLYRIYCLLFVVFFLGSQAFCNYFYFLSFLLFLQFEPKKPNPQKWSARGQIDLLVST